MINKYELDKQGTFNAYDESAVSCWFFRWKEYCRHGMWQISMGTGRSFMTADAVVDDFGNLVMVQP